MHAWRDDSSAFRRGTAGLVALVLALAAAVGAGTAAVAEVLPATLSIEKTGPSGDDLPLEPGEPFTYVVTVQCSYPVPNSGCYDATVTDTIPAPFELAGTPTVVSDGNTAAVTTTGNDVTVAFTTTFLNATDPGSGMIGGTTATITIPVVVPEDADYDFSGEDIVNTAQFEADNPDTATVDDDHVVQIEVPLAPATSVEKSFTPAEATASEGAPTVIAIDASNDSGTGVDSFVITDPLPGSSSTTFDYLALDSITITDIPAGADELVVSVDSGSGPVPAVGPVDVDTIVLDYTVDLSAVTLEDVEGIQVEFLDSEDPRIADGATAGVEVGVVQRDPGELTDDVLVDNTAGSEVSRDGSTADASADADYSITTNIPTVDAVKIFEPDTILHGETSTATVTAGVTGSLDVETLTVTEPSSGTFDDAMTFEGFVDPIAFPEGADIATITYTAGGSFTFEPGDDVPLPDDLAAVDSFTLTFEDDDGTGITAGGTAAEIPITVGTDPADDSTVTDLPNEVTVTGTTTEGVNGTDTAEDTLHVFGEHIDSTATKSITPGTITGFPGEWIVLQLSGGTAGPPVDGATDDPYSSVPSQQIVVQDPADPTAPDAFWDAFDPTQIVDVNIPGDAELTINYWDGSAWVPLNDVPFTSGDSPLTIDVDDMDPGADPADIGGLQFQYDYVGPDDGFEPGESFQPNIVMEFDPDAANTDAWEDGQPALFTNCSTAAASNGTVDSGDAPPACDDVEVVEPDPDAGPSMAKRFVNTDGSEDPSIPARSHRITHAQLQWSTGGASNVDSLTLTDEADAPPGDLTNSVYDTFDATLIGPVDGTDDPLIEYDAIDAVLIHDGTDWVVPTNSPCGPLDGAFLPACAGGLPEIVLDGAERASTVGVRIVYVEYPDARGAVDAPPVGSGVARSTAADDRTAEITYRVRDWRRSSAEPDLVAVDGLEEYNVAGEPGAVRNSASAVSVIDGASSAVADSTEIVITSADLEVSTAKTWDGSPVGIPPTDTSAEDYPFTGMDLRVTNESSIVYADELRILDNPTDGRPADDEEILWSDVFDITSIEAITLPTGASSVLVTLFDEDGDALASTTDIATATDVWDETLLAGAVGFEVDFFGRSGTSLGGPGNPTSGGIDPGAQGGIELLLQLRETDRYRDGAEIDESYAGEVAVNRSQGQVDDEGRDPAIDPEPPRADADASVDLEGFTIGVNVTKEFSDLDGTGAADPYVQTETVDGARPPFLMTLTGQPTDGARPQRMQVSDLDPSFWNAYEFVGIDPDFELAAPIQTVEMEVCTTPPLAGDLDGAIAGGCERTVDGDLSVSYSGTLESDGPTTGVPALPAGVAPEDVIGVVFTFSSDTAWENPWNPLQEIPIIVQRRETMLTPAVAPPTDLDGNPVAPGETEAGHWVNDVEGAIEAYLDDSGATGSGINNVAEGDDAEVVFAHSVTAATVTKTPDGNQPLSLAGPTTFTLTFTNTGDTPIYNPVFTDVLPTDAVGPLLFVDPTPAATGDSPYTFGLASVPDSVPAGWDALPTEQAAVTITPDPAPEGTEEIVFSFDGDYALGVGETYIITVQTLVRAGVSPEEFFTNTAIIDGDRPFDYCATGPFDPDAAEVLDDCRGDATNSVAAGGAIRSGKFVRAGTSETPDYTFGALNVVDALAECEPNVGGVADGFYTTPCVPRTAPGDTETWRLVLRNTGNVPLSQIIAVDRLPAVGDGTALNPAQARGSAWAPVLVDANSAQLDPATATLEVFVTTDEVPCTEVIRHTGNCGDAWVLFDDYAGDPAALTGLMYIVNYDDGEALQPAQVVSIEAESTTPATAPELTDPATATSDPIAWNTVATSATTQDGTDLLATEGNAAGVALITGAIELSKAVTGDGAELYAPDEFAVTVVCTSLGEQVYEQTFTVGPEDPPLVVDNLPTGAECTLEETDQGQWSATLDPEIVTVPDGSATPAQITITNDYPLASLRLTKEVVGDGSGSSVDPSLAGPFTLGALCRYQGEVVLLDEADVALPSAEAEYTVLTDQIMSVSGVRHEDSVVFTGLPAGAECIAGELDAADATQVGVGWQTVDTAGAVVEQGTVVEPAAEAPVASDVFALQPDTAAAPQPPTANDALVINQYAQGALEIEKSLDGPGASAHAEDAFTVDLYCVYERDGDGDVVTYDGAVDVTPGSPVVVEGIIVGSVCTVEEPEAGRGGADQWIFDPSDPANPSVAEVEVTDGQEPVVVSITNVFEELSSLDVTKIVSDDPLNNGQGGVPDVGPFAVAVECVYAEGTPYEREILADGFAASPMENQLLDGETWTLTGIPSATVCTVTETDDGGAVATTVVAQNAESGDAQPDQGASATIDITPNGFFDQATTEVTFENSFPVGSLAVTKELDGDGVPERGAGPFTLHVECTSPTYGVDSWSGDVVLGGDEPLTVTVDGILAPSVCTVTEPDDGGADAVLFDPGEPGDDSATVLVTAVSLPGGPATVTVTNRFEPFASLAITKSIEETVQDASGSVPHLGPFVIAVDCVYDPGGPAEHEVYAAGYGVLRPMVFVLDQGETVVLEGIPATSVCTVTERGAGGAASTTMTVTTADEGPVTVDGTAADVTLTPGATSSVGVLNTYATGSLTIEKTVSGPDVPDTVGPFVFHVECSLERPMLDPVSTYSGDIVVGGEQPLAATMTGIAAGSRCEVTEADDGGADGLILSPTDGDPAVAVVTIAAGDVVVVNAENVFDALLPVTGFDAWWIVVVAVVMLATGVVLVLARRRGRPE